MDAVLLQTLLASAPRSAALATSLAKTYDNSDPGHDFSHVLRVVTQCLALGRDEGADLDVVAAAALLHDLINVPKNHPDRILASRMAAEAARPPLAEAGFSSTDIDRICQVIVEHSHSLGLAPSSLESAVLQDADRLDALGAIGIMRTVTCGAAMGASYYRPEAPLSPDRALDDKLFTLDHFEVKLFKLAERMNTPSARAEAARRTAFMRRFLEQVRSELPLGS